MAKQRESDLLELERVLNEDEQPKMPPTEEPGIGTCRFAMPKVYIGDTVLFNNMANDEPSPAFVVAVSARMVNLEVVKGNGARAFKEAVRHAADPDREANPHIAKNGMWKHTERNQRLNDLLAQLAPTEEEKKAKEPEQLPEA